MQVIFLSAGDDRPPQGQTTLPVAVDSLLSYSLLHSLSSLRHSWGLVTSFSKTFTLLVIFVNPKLEIAGILNKGNII